MINSSGSRFLLRILSSHWVLALCVMAFTSAPSAEAGLKTKNSQRYSVAVGGSTQVEKDDSNDFENSTRIPVLLHFGTHRFDFDMIYSSESENSKLSYYQVSSTTHHLELGARYSWTLFQLDDGIPLSLYSGALVDFNWTSVATADSRNSRSDNSVLNSDFGLSTGIESRKSILFFRPEVFVLHRQSSSPAWTAGARAFLGLHWEI